MNETPSKLHARGDVEDHARSTASVTAQLARGSTTTDAPVPRSAVWTVIAGGTRFRVKTCSARKALSVAQERARQPAVIVDLTFEADVPTTRRRSGMTRADRKRIALLPEALRRRAAGETVTDIAKALHLPRETVRDWLLAAGA